MIIFSLATIYERRENLNLIIPNILYQCDLLYVNLIGYKDIPYILFNNKIIINKFDHAGSEIRFYNYNDINNEDYYVTIDDDILYPTDYSNKMIECMIQKNNDIICVHGSNLKIDIDKKFDYYSANSRTLYHFKNELIMLTNVMICGVGTSCFYKGRFRIDYSKYINTNMSDIYTSIMAKEQNIKIYSIPRKNNWLKPLNEYDKRIFGSYSNDVLNEIINKYMYLFEK
jgi:hypothetical protein